MIIIDIGVSILVGSVIYFLILFLYKRQQEVFIDDKGRERKKKIPELVRFLMVLASLVCSIFTFWVARKKDFLVAKVKGLFSFNKLTPAPAPVLAPVPAPAPAPVPASHPNPMSGSISSSNLTGGPLGSQIGGANQRRSVFSVKTAETGFNTDYEV